MSVKQELAYQRKCLKIRLWRERATWRDGLCAPWCPYCDHAITTIHGTAMHEWLIKRGALPVDMQHLIMHEYNCVLAHNGCHDKHGQTKEFTLRCAKAQYKRYGRDTIVAWVESLGLKQSVEIPTEEEVANG